MKLHLLVVALEAFVSSIDGLGRENLGEGGKRIGKSREGCVLQGERERESRIQMQVLDTKFWNLHSNQDPSQFMLSGIQGPWSQNPHFVEAFRSQGPL